MSNYFDYLLQIITQQIVMTIAHPRKLLLYALIETNTLCLTGCETWTKQRGVASLYGMLYPLTTLTDCLNLCLEMYPCVAVDVSSDVCVVHTNINDTANTFNASGFTQFILNRACLSSTPTSPLSTASSAQATSESSSVGNLYTVCLHKGSGRL